VVADDSDVDERDGNSTSSILQSSLTEACRNKNPPRPLKRACPHSASSYLDDDDEDDNRKR